MNNNNSPMQAWPTVAIITIVLGYACARRGSRAAKHAFAGETLD